MATSTILWAGKPLTDDEELRTRRLVSFLRRVGDNETADTFERFLPGEDGWTAEDELLGMTVGPGFAFGGVEVADGD